MNEKQTIVATQKIYNYEVRVVTGLIAVRFREDDEFTDSDGTLKKFGRRH